MLLTLDSSHWLDTDLNETPNRSSAVAVLRTGHGRHVSYLTSQISELTAEVGSVLPGITVDSQTKVDFIQRRSHRPQTGDPMQQLCETVSAVLQLLNELQNMPHAKLDAAMLAGKMGILSLNLSDLGLREEALEMETIVVVLRRAGGDKADLGLSLNNLSLCLSDVGRREEALEMIMEATSICRRLATDQPDAFLPDLAMSLNNLSSLLLGVGHHEEALDMIKEATSIYRILAADQPDAFCPNLAGSLNNLSLCLSHVGCCEEALEMIKEATSICRKLATDLRLVSQLSISN